MIFMIWVKIPFPYIWQISIENEIFWDSPFNVRLFDFDATGSAELICEHINCHSKSEEHDVCKQVSITLILASSFASLSFSPENIFSSAISRSVKKI